MSNRSICLAKRPTGEPTSDCFSERVEPDVRDIADGSCLVMLEVLSVDPYMRSLMNEGQGYVGGTSAFRVGEPLSSFCVATVVESKNPTYAPGDRFVDMMPWTSGKFMYKPSPMAKKIDSSLPLEYYVSLLGMPGLTAYVGLKICKASAGKVIVVNAAYGAVGQLVCQLARDLGLKVIAVAGGSDKCSKIRSELGIPEVIDYKSLMGTNDEARYTSYLSALDSCLSRYGVQGIDCVFENVGGYQLDAHMARINQFGNIAFCGSISQYNQSDRSSIYGCKNIGSLIKSSASIRGFVVFADAARISKEENIDIIKEFYTIVGPMVARGAIKYQIDVMEGGVEQGPLAFMRMLKGENVGKQVVKINKA